MMKRTIFFTSLLAMVLSSVCCGRFSSNPGSIDSRDTVKVPDKLSGEDSIAYIEDAIIKSPISADDLLGLSEVHSIEDFFCYYNNFSFAEKDPENADRYLATRLDSASMRLANRFLRMYQLVTKNGNANDKLQWAIAVNSVIDSFHLAEPSIAKDSILSEIVRVTSKFSSLTQTEMNYQSYLDARMAYYQTIEAYRKWLLDVAESLRTIAQEEYIAWHDLIEARFSFWRDVSNTQTWYSAKPMEINSYYENLLRNRLVELGVEHGIVLGNKEYNQIGTTVTKEKWEEWITKHSEPEDIEDLREMELENFIPDDSIVIARVSDLKRTFSRWIAARQAFAKALPKEQRTSYDNLTADIHSRLIDELPDAVSDEE